jgi:hypothetical protein
VRSAPGIAVRKRRIASREGPRAQTGAKSQDVNPFWRSDGSRPQRRPTGRLGVKVRLSPKDLQNALNGDSEFRIASRYWDGSLSFEFGSQVCRLALRGGEVVSIDAEASRPERADVVVKAPVEDWAKLLEAVPPPFYQEFYPASMHHGFRLDGDPDYIWPYYWALRRSAEILRSVASVEKD